MEPTETAHRAWDARWQTAEGRAEWLDADSDVVAVADALAGRGGGRVLDLGCGVGRHALVFAALGLETVALDGSAAGIAHLEDSARTRGLRIETRLGQMTELPFPEADFDYLLAFNVIYHGDPGVVRQAIAEIRRVLKPGGLYQGTMLSKRNVKFGCGREIAPDTFVIDDGDEKSHAHYYCDAAGLVGLFAGFELLSLWTALRLQVDVDLSGLVSCKHLSGVTRCNRGAQMGHPLTQTSIAGRPQGPR